MLAGKRDVISRAGHTHHLGVSGSEATFGVDDFVVNCLVDGFVDLVNVVRL